MATSDVNLGSKGHFKVHKGALHRATHTPEGQKIPASKMAGARHSSNPHTRHMAASAAGFKAMAHHKIHGNDDMHDARGQNGGGGPDPNTRGGGNRGGGVKPTHSGAGSRGRAEHEIKGKFGGRPIGVND